MFNSKNSKTRFDTNVIAINFFPDIQDGEILKNMLKVKELKGIVLKAYGAGIIPTSPKVLILVKRVTERGVVLLDVTQCEGEKVELGMYKTSALLFDVGVVSGVDITPEATLIKLMVLLVYEDLESPEVALRVQQDIAEEQSLCIFITEFRSYSEELNSNATRKKIPAADFSGQWNSYNEIDKIMLCFRGEKIKSKDKYTYSIIKILHDIGSDKKLDEKNPNDMGQFKRLPNGEPTILLFDITEKAKLILGKRASFNVFLASEEGSFSWDSVELTVFKKNIH